MCAGAAPVVAGGMICSFITTMSSRDRCNSSDQDTNSAGCATDSGSLGAQYDALRLPVAVLLDNIRSMYNVGAFFRVADGVGLERLCLCGITAHPPKNAITKTALGAEKTVEWEHDWDAVKMAERLRASGYELVAIETSREAVDLFEWQPRFPLCVAFGNEVEGLHPKLLEMATSHVRIPMFGHKKSLNVATAGGVVLYELLRKYRAMNIPR